jgi:lipopolysaccharide transport system permease protein
MDSVSAAAVVGGVAVPEPKPYLTIRPTTGWAALDLAEVVRYRDLLWTFAVRDIKLRYRQTALGVAWVIIQPVLAAGILSFVFGKIGGLGAGLSYFAVVYAGQLGWQAFNTTVTKNSSALVANSHMVSKVYFPRLILPLSTILATLVDFLVALPLILAVLPLVDAHPTLAGLAMVPVWLGIMITIAMGFGLIAGALMVQYRDVQYIVPVAVQSLFFASPVAYPAGQLLAKTHHAWAATVYYLNPLAAPLEGFRWSLLGMQAPWWGHAAYSAAFAVAVFAVGAYWFKRMERTFADVI